MWYQALPPHLRLQKIHTPGGYSSAPALSNKAQALAEIACASWRLTLQQLFIQNERKVCCGLCKAEEVVPKNRMMINIVLKKS